MNQDYSKDNAHFGNMSTFEPMPTLEPMPFFGAPVHFVYSLPALWKTFPVANLDDL